MLTRYADNAIDMTRQPVPSYILRSHSSQISSLSFSSDGRTLYSGDIDGWAIAWNLRTFRPKFVWQAHQAGILTFAEFDNGLLTHGRDNMIRYWKLPKFDRSIPSHQSSATGGPSVKTPTQGLTAEFDMDVNAMAYCQMSLLRMNQIDPKGKGKQIEPEFGMIAVPALTKDDLVDIFHLPSLKRVHRSVGANSFLGSKTGTLMAVSLFLGPSDASSTRENQPERLHLLTAYEDGRVAMFVFTGKQSAAFEPPTGPRDEAEGWDLLWEEKGHREAIMGLALSRDKQTAWTVAADHFLCRYNLFPAAETSNQLQQFVTTAPGRAAIAIRDDNKLVAVAGWNGETRLYSAKSGKPLAVLSFHRQSLHAIAFSPMTASTEEDIEEGTSDEYTSEEEDEFSHAAVTKTGKMGRNFLAVGGKDERISLWQVYPPETR